MGLGLIARGGGSPHCSLSLESSAPRWDVEVLWKGPASLTPVFWNGSRPLEASAGGSATLCPCSSFLP